MLQSCMGYQIDSVAINGVRAVEFIKALEAGAGL